MLALQMFPPTRHAYAGSTGLLILLVAAAVAALPLNQVLPRTPHCHDERCQLDRTYEYRVEGKKIDIYSNNGFLRMICFGLSVMDSPALPRFNPTFAVKTVIMQNCPPPSTGSLMDSLATLNVTLITDQPVDEHEGLKLWSQPIVPSLAARHFYGLESLQRLYISGKENERIRPERGFLTPLKNLEYLNIEEAEITNEDLSTLSPKLQHLSLIYTSMESMPQALLSTNLQELSVLSRSAFDGVAVPTGLSELFLSSAETTLRLESTQALRSLMLKSWVDEQPQPLKSCDNLTFLSFGSMTVKALPDYWLAQCFHLDRLILRGIKSPSSLPPKLLANVTALTSLSIVESKFETLPAELLHDTTKLSYLHLRKNSLRALPAGLLNYAPKLFHLDLSDNHLQILPSGFFSVPRKIRTLLLVSNELKSDAIPEIAKLDGVISLNITDNPRIGDVCTEHGIQWTTKLGEHETNVMRLCTSFNTDKHFLRVPK